MDLDYHQQRAQTGFPVEQPTEALKQDHQYVKQLFDSYLGTQSVEVKKQACSQALLALDMHTSLEEGVFYPKVHSLDPQLVDHGEHEHQEIKDMMAQIRGMEPGDPECDRLFKQLADAVSHHVQTEEQQLFPKVLQSNLDLTALGLEMQSFEAAMVSDQARQSEKPGLRR